MKLLTPTLAVLSAATLFTAGIYANGAGSANGRVNFDEVTFLAPLYPLGSTPLYVNTVTPTDQGIVVSTKGDKSLSVFNAEMTQRTAHWQLPTVITGVAVKENVAYVTTDDNTIRTIDLKTGAQGTPVQLKAGATSPILANDAIYVMEQFAGTVAKLNPATLEVLVRGQALREPKGAVLSDDGKRLFVLNFLPAQRADLDYVAADVTVFNTKDLSLEKNIKLANGSNALRGITISPEGNYIFVSHNMGRFTVPTSQLQQGWMNTSAMSVIDARTMNYMGAIILDEPDRGAAGIWDIKCADNKIVVSHSGTHDVSVIDYPAFIQKLTTYKGDVETLAYDLRFMYGLRQRVPIVGNGPRNMAVKDHQIIIPTYFSDTVNIMNLEDCSLKVVAMVQDRKETLAQEGEKYFNNAEYCFQNWQSCNGCHPGDARTDGMNWDLMNDGIGNSKNCKSLLYSIQTPPSMISGIRVSAQLANRKGFTHIQFYNIPEEKAKALDAYTTSLQALPSPYLENGQLSAAAARGQKVFQKLECDNCHGGPYYTDMKMHRIGEDIEFEAGWDTPTLREVWRTAPYLFDGRAQTMLEVFTTNKHGIDKKVSTKDLEDLTQYVLSL